MTAVAKRQKKPERICPVCKRKFIARRTRGKIQTYCSRECSYIGRIKQVQIPCKECGKFFMVKQCQVGKRMFCSEKCYGENKSKNQKGKNNPVWKGRISKTPPGGGRKNTARKGRYYENIARKELEKQGFYTIRSAASKGVWDVVGINNDFIILVQTKFSRIPRIQERKEMEEFICPSNAIKQYWRFFGHGRKEIATLVNGKWEIERFHNKNKRDLQNGG